MNKKIFIYPTDRFFDYPIYLEDKFNSVLHENQIVEMEVLLNNGKDKSIIKKVEKTHGNSDRADLYSFLSLKESGLANKFSSLVINQTKKIKRKKSSHEIDLTSIPFVTIDPVDAKDRDDAIFANFEIPKNNEKVFCEIWISIADVSSFFEIGGKIDNEALKRGNSTYLSDIVIPMLPTELSNNYCSLEENKIRYAVTLKITFDEKGNKLGHAFYKGKIKVKYNLNYEEVEKLISEKKTKKNLKFYLIKNLNKATKLLNKMHSNILDIKISEPKIENNHPNKRNYLNTNKSLQSNKIVENLMILANKCVGETLSKSNLPVIYRHHEKPNIFNLNKLNRSLMMLGFSSGEKKTQPFHFNNILAKKTDPYIKNLISIIILQNMTQAYYSSEFYGHYGLSQTRYVHFTSPIRRYADLLIHRLLHIHLKWDLDEKEKIDILNCNTISSHISSTERKSIKAEKKTHSRYLASYMKQFINKNFEAIIYNISHNRAFFFLKENHIQGACLFKESLQNTRKKSKIKKELEISNISLSIGDLISVKLISTNPFNGNIYFEFQNLIEKFVLEKNK